MIYRMKNELERTPIEGCMGGNGTVWMEKLLTGQEERVKNKVDFWAHLYKGS